MKYLMFGLFVLFTFNSCDTSKTQNENPIQPGVVTITGQIEDFDNSSSTGKLYYSDAVTRISKFEVISIDSTGFFITSFQLTCPSQTVTLLIQGTGCKIYAVPDQVYNIIINKNGKCTFTGDNSDINNHLIELEKAIKLKFKDDIRKRSDYTNNDTSKYAEYEKFCIDISKKQLAFVNEYCKDNLINDKAVEIVTQNIKYEPATALMGYRWNFNTSPAHKRKGLPEDYFINVYEQFPINNPDAISCKTYSAYISNITRSINEELKSYATFFL